MSRDFHLTTGTFNLLSKIESRSRLSGRFSIEAGRSPVLDTRSTRRTPRCTLHRGEPFKLTANRRLLSTAKAHSCALPSDSPGPGRTCPTKSRAPAASSADPAPERSRASTDTAVGDDKFLKIVGGRFRPFEALSLPGKRRFELRLPRSRFGREDEPRSTGRGCRLDVQPDRRMRNPSYLPDFFLGGL